MQSDVLNRETERHVHHAVSKNTNIIPQLLYDLEYRLRQNLLTSVDSYLYLEVNISSDVRWSTHIDSICAKATGTLNLIRRHIYRCPTESKSFVHTALVGHTSSLQPVLGTHIQPNTALNWEWCNAKLPVLSSETTVAPPQHRQSLQDLGRLNCQNSEM
jgi:hypothetical protein